MYATRAYRAGETVFEEKPFVSAQFAWNAGLKYRACEYCLRPLETASENVARLANDASIELPHPDCCPTTERRTIAACPHCAVEYCSEDCRNEAAQRYHCAVCPMTQSQSARDAAEHPLHVLIDAWKKIHYPPETCSIMLLVKLVGMYQQSTGLRREEFLATLRDFQNKVVNETDRIAHKMLGANFEQQLAELYPLYCRAFAGPANRHPDVDLGELLSPAAFKTLFAIVGTNGQGLGTSPFAVWVKRVTEKAKQLPQDEQLALDSLIDDVYEQLDNVSGMQFINNEGSALYGTQSKINHSCRPNAQPTFPYSDHTMVLEALRDIAAGEEIHISYLDECALQQSRHSRQRDLRENYLFQCQCEKCVEQRDQPDVTSDEEEEEEDDEEDDDDMDE